MHWLDRLFYLALPRQPFFARGWGDAEIVEGARIERLLEIEPEPAAVVWGAERRRGVLRVRDGEFESPEVRLPPCARRARVRLLSPPAGARAACLLLAATGDQGFAMRTHFAAPLVRDGVAALLLENPLYGARRLPGERGVPLRVSDLVLMAAATLREARALAAMLRAGGRRVAVSGYSMGGQMAAVVGATLPFPLAVVPLAPSDSPAAVFTEGMLSRHPRWAALARGGATPERARRDLREFLSRFAVTRLPPPREPRAAIVVATRRDGVVPPEEQRRIAEHWGCELRWLPDGHVSAFLRRGPEMRRAIADALARLP